MNSGAKANLSVYISLIYARSLEIDVNYHMKQSTSLNAIPSYERPRERMMQYGSSALSNAELIAILLRTGTSGENVLQVAENILTRCGGLSGLMEATQADLMQISGLGTAKVTQLMAVVELIKRVMVMPPSERPLIERAEDAFRLLSDMQFLQQEHVRVVLLDSSRRVISTPTVYIGTINSSILRVSELFREAITRNSAAIILAHNHPSGDPAPSPEDFELTRDLIAAGRLLDIPVLDHLIIGRSGWQSLKALGIAFAD